MNRKDALKTFRQDVLPEVVRRYGRGDWTALREAWNDWTDALCKDGEITSKQYETWSNPF